MTKNLFTWGETVKITIDAPKHYKSGKLAEICSMWEIKTQENSKVHGEPVGTFIYSIEFADGLLIEIPDRYLEKYSAIGE
jgi:hypothetical protein